MKLAESFKICLTTSNFAPTPLILIGYIIIMLYYFSKYSDSQSVDEALGNYLQLSFGVFLVYLGFYFSIYMVLAFINDPIVTGFVYLIGILCIICAYLISYVLCLIVTRMIKKLKI